MLTKSARTRTRYVAVVFPPRGPAWIEYAGAPGESAERVEANAAARLAELCAPYPSYARIQVIPFSGALHAYYRELRRYEQQQEYERTRAAACGAPTEPAQERRWRRLESVDGYGPHGLCDTCGAPLESLASLNDGRCARCVLTYGAPTEKPDTYANEQPAD